MSGRKKNHSKVLNPPQNNACSALKPELAFRTPKLWLKSPSPDGLMRLSELERRKEGVFYCVEIVNDGNEYEVLIDAKTGHVLKVDNVKPDTQPDAESSSSTSSDSKLQNGSTK